MRGDMEIHRRHIIYFALGIFSGIAVKLFVCRVLLSQETFLTNPLNLSDTLMFAVWMLWTLTGLGVDYYVCARQNDMDERRFRRNENLIVSGFALLSALLLVTSYV